MPSLSEIVYSEAATITAVQDYYQFLTKMYLENSAIIHPPEGGWPSITTESLRGLGKTEKVISLLRRLPYIGRWKGHGAAYTEFADWESDTKSLLQGKSNALELILCSEIFGYTDHIPNSVVGLTSGGRDNPIFLLDTQLGIIYWYDCPWDHTVQPLREEVSDDPYDYAPENEAEWRAECRAWAIADFFEILKNEFKKLNFVPLSPEEVTDVYSENSPGLIVMVQDIYHNHGWPNLEQYNKQECLEAVQAAVEEHEASEQQ
ncbi:hypothetical protein BT63DRAFT_444830 [Microthyrium microscopicum]|uniref:Uncharacterized protein n=1 Tax=Microthyrium microscopicum TaxID=703497 RepID=A0A6A6UQJ6_9PEZI|nr:hypothetical protein BT63DRAFT_444830 [Microthyrium microscopicum]